MPQASASPYAYAVPSATVVLVRDSERGPEVLMVLRHANTSFGASYVFPGGLLHAEDAGVAEHCPGLTDNDANRTLDLGSGGLAYYSAAIRELFEEAGVLLARTRDGLWANADALAEHRDALNEGRASWVDFLARYELHLACDSLHYFSFWITPREVRKRFSTRFFVAGMPQGQSATHCGTEVTDSRWMSPAAALSDNEAGLIEVPHPTVRTLRNLAKSHDAAAMLAWADRRGRDGVECILPAIVTVDEQQQVVMPGDPGYPDYGRDEAGS